MIKKLIIGTLAAVIIVAVGASAYIAMAAPEAKVQSLPVTAGLSNELVPVNSMEVGPVTDTSVQTIPAASLTVDETAGLLFMFEEEKLARDVYNALFSIWGQPTFQNIASSEQMHMDAVKLLLVQYGIEVPGDVAGVFNDASLQALYDSLIAAGNLSLADALKVGATIEEVDIMDLQSRLALTQNSNIQLVYNNLMNGSHNHLRNFVNVLQRQTGEVYQPQYLSAELYQTILSNTNGNGQGGTNGSGTSVDTGITTTDGNGYRGGRP
jgi:hypothetical protein